MNCYQKLRKMILMKFIHVIYGAKKLRKEIMTMSAWIQVRFSAKFLFTPRCRSTQIWAIAIEKMTLNKNFRLSFAFAKLIKH